MRNAETIASHPIMSCEAAADYEVALLDSEAKVWAAMQSVGRLLGQGILDEYRMTRYAPERLSVLALIGKGHNGGDAMLAIREMARMGRVERVVLALDGNLGDLKPNTKKAFDRLQEAMDPEKMTVLACRQEGVAAWLDSVDEILQTQSFAICLDGLYGMQFRAPLREAGRGLIERVNAAPRIGLRVAVDMPSGMGRSSDELTFRADVSFATGIFKQPLLSRERAEAIGCIRYLDVGFFETPQDGSERVITDAILDPLRERRPAIRDKRSHGHLLIVAGSRKMPGALMMSVRSALQSGAGLVTVCAPESMVAPLASQLPEAMWLPWPETPEGELALEGLYLTRPLQGKATALLVGPGMGSEAETIEMLAALLREWEIPTVIDADALRPKVVEAAKGRFIATPHAGELARLLGSDVPDSDLDAALRDYAAAHGGVVVLKGPNTRVAGEGGLYINTTGNTVLSRGGSGDLLAGMSAGLLAQSPSDFLGVACRAVYWHGKAADALAATRGQVAVKTTDLLDYYATALDGRAYGTGVDA